jgi:tetratricopeptide (TPR) repeat protein
VNLTFRLLDAAPLKAALVESPGALALITSDWFFDEVVRHSRGTDPATFRQVPVHVKETTTVGWISLPDHPYPSDPAELIRRPVGLAQGPVPRQLPAPPRSFIGRTTELAALTTAVDNAGNPDGAVVICTIGGAGGIGKTWLALRWARDNMHRFPDGQLFVDLRGFSPDGQPMTPAVAVRGFLDALGVSPAEIPVDPHAQAALFRSLAASRRMLVVLDNAINTEQVAPLLPGSLTCTVLVTSRSRLPGLTTGHGAYHVSLDALTDGQARALFITRIGSTRVDAEHAAVDDLVEFCQGFPLALSIIIGRAETHPSLPLASLAAELHEAGVNALDSADPTASLPTVLSWSHQALTSEQAAVLVLVGFAPGPNISLDAAASLNGSTTTRTRTILRSLEQLSLLDYNGTDRYQLHDLIRRYVTDTADGHTAAIDRDTALRRVIDFYLHTAYAADQLLDPHRESATLAPPTPGCTPHPLPDEGAALAWLDTEHACLLAAQRLAADRGWHASASQFALILHTYHWRRGRLDVQVTVGRIGLAAAERTGEAAAHAMAHRQLAEACALMDRHTEALDHLRQALTLAQHVGDRTGQAHTHRILAWTKSEHDEIQPALEHITHALRLFQALDDEEWEARALNQTAWYSALLGHHEQARTSAVSALYLHRRHHNLNGEALSLGIQGFLAHQTGRHHEALRYCMQSLAMLEELGNTYFTAQILDILGHIHAALGHNGQARASWRRALHQYREQHRARKAQRVQQLLDTLDRAAPDNIDPN